MRAWRGEAAGPAQLDPSATVADGIAVVRPAIGDALWARAILHGAGRRNVVGSVSVWVDGNEHRPSAVAQGTYALPREAAGAA